jgi:hypothetical protein
MVYDMCLSSDNGFIFFISIFQQDVVVLQTGLVNSEKWGGRHHRYDFYGV